MLIMSGCTSKIDKLQEDLTFEKNRVNYCQEDFDCTSYCLSPCPGSFMVHNKEENLESFLSLYSEYMEEKYKNESRPRFDCFMDFCDIGSYIGIGLLCNNNKCKLKENRLGLGNSCINCN